MEFTFQLTVAGLAAPIVKYAFDLEEPFRTCELDDWTLVAVAGEPTKKWGAVPVTRNDVRAGDQKLVSLLIGILGAGASFLAGMKLSPTLGTRWGLTALALSVVALGGVVTNSRDDARRTTRALLVRCEEALGFYAPGLAGPNGALYPGARKTYAEKGAWLGRTTVLVLLAAAAFVIVVWTL